MKNEELDRLFRQKLEQLEGQPSTQAWQQLEQQLQQKKQRKTWFYLSSIAASLLLLLGIWGSLEYSSSFIPAAPLAHEQEPAQKKDKGQNTAVVTAPAQQPKEAQQLSTINGHEPAEKEKQTPTQTTGHKGKSSRQTQLARTGTAVKKPAQKTTPPAAEPVELPQAEAKTALINSLAEVSQEELTKPAAVIEPVIISYKADDDEINNKTVELTERESKGLTPRKVFGFLKKVKENSSGSLAELREAKDDLLSLRLSRVDFNRAD